METHSITQAGANMERNKDFKSNSNYRNLQFWHGQSCRNCTQKQLGIRYGILDSMSMSNTIYVQCLLSVAKRDFCHLPFFWADSVPSPGGQIYQMCFYFLAPELLVLLMVPIPIPIPEMELIFNSKPIIEHAELELKASQVRSLDTPVNNKFR